METQKKILGYPMEAFRANNPVVWETTHRATEKFLRRNPRTSLNSPEDIEDAAIETMLRLHRSLTKYPQLALNTNNVYRMARNIMKDMAIKQRHYRSIPLGPADAEDGSVDVPTTDRSLPDHVIIKDRVNHLLSNLTPVQRRATIAIYYIGMQIKELAAQTGEPEGTIKAQLSRARDAAEKIQAEERVLAGE